MFVNFSNHSIKTWSKEQYQAAVDFGYGTPVDSIVSMPMVSPHANPGAVYRIATEIFDAARHRGMKACMIAGELSLCIHLYNLCLEHGIPVFSATSERISVEEKQEDGSTKKTSVFKFVQFRYLV